MKTNSGTASGPLRHRASENLIPHVRQAIDAVVHRPCTFATRGWEPRLAPRGSASLTRREHQVLAQIVACATNREAGKTLGISGRMVEAHRAHIMHKLGAKNALDLMRIVFSSRDVVAPHRLST